MADHLFGAIAEQSLGAFIEKDDVALLVGRNDGVGRTLDESRKGALSFLNLGIGGESDLLRLFARGDVGPGAYQLEGTPGIIVDHLEGVLDPDVVTVAMAEAVLDTATSPSDERLHVTKGAWRVVGMEMIRPNLWVCGHLLGRIAHNRTEIFAYESAGVIAGRFGRVDNRRADGEQILKALTRAL